MLGGGVADATLSTLVRAFTKLNSWRQDLRGFYRKSRGHYAARRIEYMLISFFWDFLERLTGVLHVDVVETPFRVQDLLGVRHDVGHLPLEPAGGLVDHDAGIWHGEPQAFGSRREQERGHGGRLSDAQSRYRWAHELHRVVDRKSR